MGEHSRNLFNFNVVLYVIGGGLFLCGFGFPNWIDMTVGKLGMLQYCDKLTDKKCKWIEYKDYEDFYNATFALMVLSMLCIGGCFLSFAWLPVTAVLHCITGALLILAVIIFGSEAEDEWPGDLDWAFFLTAISGVLFLVNGVVMVVFAFQSECNMSSRLSMFKPTTKVQDVGNGKTKKENAENHETDLESTASPY